MRRLWTAGVLAVALLTALALPAHLQQRPVAQDSAASSFSEKLSIAAVQRANLSVRYDPAYVHIAYPNGDVPAGTGVCTDEVIRSYRALGIDLQKEVHEDMLQNFSAYPNQRRWRLAHTDTNIDHRRVPNLQVFFSRKGQSLPITTRAEDYPPGELVTWDLGGGVPHIGIVVNKKSPDGTRYLIEHNIGAGPKLEDVLFSWKITGHYHYSGPLLTAAVVKVEELAGSFKQAAALGDAQEKERATRAYLHLDLMPYYQKKYSPVFQSCLMSTDHADTSPFSFVVAIGKDGRVARTYVDYETNIYTCVRQTLQKDEFPHPPISPYYMHMSMSFSK